MLRYNWFIFWDLAVLAHVTWRLCCCELILYFFEEEMPDWSQNTDKFEEFHEDCILVDQLPSRDDCRDVGRAVSCCKGFPGAHICAWYFACDRTSRKSWRMLKEIRRSEDVVTMWSFRFFCATLKCVLPSLAFLDSDFWRSDVDSTGAARVLARIDVPNIMPIGAKRAWRVEVTRVCCFQNAIHAIASWKGLIML